MTTYLPDHRTSSDDSSSEKGGITPVAQSFTDEKNPNPPLGAPVESASKGFWARWKQPPRDLDSIATQPSVFDDPVTLEAYRPPPQVSFIPRFLFSVFIIFESV
jgi:hypothetical protein